MEEQVLKATRRTTSGSANARRRRHAGEVLAILYGHGEDVVSLALAADAVHHMIENGHHLVTLEIEGSQQSAIIKQVQWDTWSRHILHIDFGRVALDEHVTCAVEIVSHGTPKDVASGAVLTQPLHSIEVTCTAGNIPDAIRVEIGHLETGQAVHVRDLELPEGVVVAVDPAVVVISLQEPRGLEADAEAEPEAAEVGTAEPEVIGKGSKETAEEGEAES